MKKLLAACAIFALAQNALTADGATIYKKCAACHGAKAEKTYLNKVPALSTLTPDERLAALKGYKDGSLGKGKFGMGGIMKGQVLGLSEADMNAVNEYIQTLK